MVGGCGLGGISFGQAIARGGTDWRNAARVRIVEGSRKGTLLMREETPRSIVVCSVLEKRVNIQMNFFDRDVKFVLETKTRSRIPAS